VKRRFLDALPFNNYQAIAGMVQMLDNLFLAYANHSFKDDPKNLYKVFNEIFPFIPNNEIPAKTQCEYIIDHIISFAKDNDPKIADKHRKEIISHLVKQGVLNLEEPLLDIAFEAVYRYRDGYCESGSGCFTEDGIDLSEIPKKSGFKGDKRLKCHECRQLHFISILSDITDGKHYETMIPKKSTITIDKEDIKIHNGSLFPYKIGDKIELPSDNQLTFETYVEKAYDCVSMEANVTNSGELEIKPFVSLRNLTNVVPPPRYPFIKFPDYLISLLGYSLAEFLLGKDRQGIPNRKRLKKCPVCENFFEGRLNQIYCSKKCNNKAHELPAEKRRIYQRDYRKDKTRGAQREAKIGFNEKQIQINMNVLGITRKEAIEMMEEGL